MIASMRTIWRGSHRKPEYPVDVDFDIYHYAHGTSAVLADHPRSPQVNSLMGWGAWDKCYSSGKHEMQAGTGSGGSGIPGSARGLLVWMVASLSDYTIPRDDPRLVHGLET